MLERLTHENRSFRKGLLWYNLGWELLTGYWTPWGLHSGHFDLVLLWNTTTISYRKEDSGMWFMVLSSSPSSSCELLPFNQRFNWREMEISSLKLQRLSSSYMEWRVRIPRTFGGFGRDVKRRSSFLFSAVFLYRTLPISSTNKIAASAK